MLILVQVNMIGGRMKFPLGLFLLTALLWPLYSVANPIPTQKQILVINSYHIGYPWSDEEMRGIETTLHEARSNYETHILQLDAKRIHSENWDRMQAERISYKMKKIPFDAVILLDNDAFDFARKYSTQLFHSMPVVFCGVDHFRRDQIAALPNFTGVAENIDYDKAIQVALQLFPETKNVWVVFDETTTGQLHHLGIHDALSRIGKRNCKEINFSALSIEKTLSQLSQIPSTDIVFMLSFFRDKTGRIFSQDEALKHMMKVCKVPTFCLTDSRIQHGVLGGYVIKGYDHGKAAADLLRAIINGQAPSSLAIRTNLPGHLLLDYTVAKRWNIKSKISGLPVEYLNKIPTFYEQNKTLVNATSAVMVLLFLFVILLGWNVFTRRKAEKALRMSEEKFRSLYEQASVGVVQIDALTGKFLDANQKCCQILGRKKEELLKLTLLSLLHPEDAQNDLQILAELREGHIAEYQSERRLIHANGQSLWVMLNISPRLSEENEAGWHIAIFQDITEKKLLEEELIRSERLSAVGQLSAGIAHEFNNILMILKGNLELMKMNSFSESELPEVIDTLEKQTDRGKQIVSQMMAISTPRPKQLSSVSINKLLDDVLDLQKEQMKLENIVVKRTSLTDSFVDVDSQQLQQVFLNIILNARHALIPKKGGHIRISTNSSGGRVTIIIEDDGIGMKEGVKAKIFTPFFTTKGAFADNQLGLKGSGLGLSICLRIMENHGGSITFTSEEGTGSRFFLSLPETKSLIISQTPPSSPKEEKSPYLCERALVVDDEKDIRTIMVKILEKSGCKHTDTVGSAEEALQKAVSNEYDIILADLMMSGKDGRVFLQELREKGDKTPVIFISGKLDVTREELIELGAIDFIRKPYDLETVRTVLHRIFQPKTPGNF